MDGVNPTQDALARMQAAGGPEGSLATKLKHAKSADDVDAAAKEFEAVFLAQMLAPMFAGIKTDGPFGGGHAEDTYRSLMMDAYAEEIVAAGGIGIADQLKAELLKTQEASGGGRFPLNTE